MMRDTSDDTSDETAGNESDRLPPATTLQGQLNRLLASLGSDDAASVRGVFGAWRELVGDAVADHVQPVKLDRSTLVVEVADPHWRPRCASWKRVVRENFASHHDTGHLARSTRKTPINRAFLHDTFPFPRRAHN